MKTPSEEQQAHAGLSDEEIAALEEEENDEGTEEETAEDKSSGSGADDDDQKEVLPQTPADADDEESAAALSGDKAVEDASIEDETDDDEAPKEIAALPMVDTFAAQLAARGIPTDFQDQLDATIDAIDAIDKQLEEGEIEYAEHVKLNREYTARLGELNAIKREAEFVAGNNELIADQKWAWEVDRFTDENPTFKDPIAYGALRGALEQLYADEENAGKSFRWFLKEAGGSVANTFGTTVKDDAPAPKATKAKKEASEEEIKEDLKTKKAAAPPQTLGDVPASSKDVETKDEFASLDEMGGMELEEHLAKMPKSKVDQYLNSRNY